jgi:hypothetical protein
MQFWNDSDIPTLINGVGGVPVTIGGVTGVGIPEYPEQPFQSPERELEDAVTILPVTKVLVQTTAFPNIAIGDSIVVDGGTTYKVRNRMRVEDGALTAVYLGTGDE